LAEIYLIADLLYTDRGSGRNRGDVSVLDKIHYVNERIHLATPKRLFLLGKALKGERPAGQKEEVFSFFSFKSATLIPSSQMSKGRLCLFLTGSCPFFRYLALYSIIRILSSEYGLRWPL
jgi:hypothetical protein